MRALAFLSFFAIGWFGGTLWSSASTPSALEIAILLLLACFAAYAGYMDTTNRRLRRMDDRERDSVS